MRKKNITMIVLLNDLAMEHIRLSDFLKFVRPSGQKITRTSNTAK
jgi:hypothetical protein